MNPFADKKINLFYLFLIAFVALVLFGVNIRLNAKDLVSGNCIAVDQSEIARSSISPDGKSEAYFITGINKKHLCLRAVTNSESTALLQSFSNLENISDIIWSNDSQKVTIVLDYSSDHRTIESTFVWVFNLISKKEWRIDPDLTKYANSITWSPDDLHFAYVAIADEDYDIYLVDVVAEKVIISAGSVGLMDAKLIWSDNNLLLFNIYQINGETISARISLP